MKLNEFKETIDSGKLLCPSCGQAIRQFEKFVDETISSIWDGAGDSKIENVTVTASVMGTAIKTTTKSGDMRF